MTEQAKAIILDAFEDIVAGIDEDSLEAADARTAIRTLNRIMATLEARSIFFGFTPVTTLASDITVDDGAIDPIIQLLAFRLWPKYRSAPMPEIISANASQAINTLLMISLADRDLTPTYPDILPVGSGNTYYTDAGIVFYSESDDEDEE